MSEYIYMCMVCVHRQIGDSTNFGKSKIGWSLCYPCG